MAYLFCTGFERSLADEGAATAGTVTVDEVHGYTGKGLVLDKPASATDTSFLVSSRAVAPFSVTSPHYGTGKQTLSQSIRFKIITASSSSSYSLIMTLNGLSTGLNFDLLLNNANNLAVSSETGHGSPTSVIGGQGLVTGKWYLLEWRTNATANPHTLNIRVNGADTTTLTIAQAAENSQGLCLGQKLGAALDSISWKIAYDDWVITDSTSFIGEHRVRHLIPDNSAADLDTNWSINGGSANRMDATDDNPVATGTNIQSSTSGQTQRLEMTSYAFDAGASVKVIDVRGYCQGSGATGTMTATMQSGAGSDGTSANWAYANGSYRYQPFQVAASVFENVPGGTGWASGDLNSARVKLTKDATANTVQIADVWAYMALTGDTPGAGGFPTDGIRLAGRSSRVPMPMFRGPGVESVRRPGRIGSGK